MLNQVIPVSEKILLHFFKKYGKVVRKEDWVRIKEECPKIYKEICSKKSQGYCYYYSREIALFLENAKLMYCSIKGNDGEDTAHAVIVKNDCIYCTNARQHYDLEEYKEIYGVNVYKMFSKEEYCNKDFFDNIRKDFVNWCAKHNVYCNPQ